MASGLPWTVVHPGGLVNEEGGVRALCLGVDDVIKVRVRARIGVS